MEDIKNLTDAEVRTLCEAIGAEALKQFYKSCPKNFNKIHRGFRASTLSADKIIDLTVKNRDQEFIARFLKLNRDALLRKERREEFARLTDLTTDIAKAELKRNAIRDEIAAASKQLTETQSRLAKVKRGAEFYTNRHKDLEQKVSDLQNQCDKLNDSIERRKREIDDLNSEIAQHRLELDDLISDIEQRSRENDDLNFDIEQHRLELDALHSEIAKCQFTLDNLNDAIEQRNREIDDLNDKIDQLRYECSPFPISIEHHELDLSSLPTKIYRAGQTLNIEVDPESFIDAFIDALDIEGEKIAKFAEYLRAAFEKHMPLLLAGPRAHDIADAFSIALTGKTAAVLDCSGVESLDDLNIVETNDDTIIAAINPLAPNFVAYLPELLGIKDKFVIAILPFAEDLKFEPRGLFNYFLPICTELVLPKRINQFDYVSDELRELLEGDA